MGAATRIMAGAMSGTSADGVDVALVEITGRGLAMTARPLQHHARPYDADLRRSIFAMRTDGSADLAALGRLGREISLAYAMAVNDALAEAGLAARQIAAVAAHGQTLYHEPPNTIQWLDPALLAAETGCAVVSDFRRADCAAGGQGAPLVPFADYILFRHPERNRILLNIGGIANATYLPAAGGPPNEPRAFDTGPGNCISDYLMRQYLPDSGGIDRDGQLATRGRVNGDLVQHFMSDPYFRRIPPKTTDIDAMIRIFETTRDALSVDSSLEDLLATACEITAQSVAVAQFLFPWKIPDEFIVSGGGTRNHCIMERLATQLGRTPCRTTDEFGISSESKEAIAFALLGAATLDGVPSNVPSATGAKRSVVLGSITPAPSV